MKRYFKHAAESDLGAGISYFEFEDEWAVRQVETEFERIWEEAQTRCP
jgi:hypothetical protein